MAFEDLALTIFDLGVTEGQINNYFENIPQPPASPEPSPITTQKVVAIANALYVIGIEAAGGIKKLSQAVKLKTSQVKMIIKELEALKAVWDEINNPPEEPEEPIE